MVLGTRYYTDNCFLPLAFQRVLLKLSGEALAAGQGLGVDETRIYEIASELADVHSLGVQIAIVVGGGNFFRGVVEQARDMDRVAADHMGMLATVINALALQDALEKQGVYTRVQSAIEMNQVAEPFIRARHSASGKRARGDLRRRNWESLLFNRHRRVAAGDGDQGRCHPESYQGRWGL